MATIANPSYICSALCAHSCNNNNQYNHYNKNFIGVGALTPLYEMQLQTTEALLGFLVVHHCCDVMCVCLNILLVPALEAVIYIVVPFLELYAI